MITILNILVLTLALISHAADELSCQEAAQITLSTLRQQGVDNLGLINIKDLSEDMARKTRWVIVRDRFMVGSGGDRATAVYDIENNLIFVNQLSLKLMDPKLLPDSCLHEGLSVNGFEDENYEKTIALRQLSRNQKIGESVYLKHLSDPRPKRTQNKIYKNENGGTSVGGGGDWTCLDLKIRILDEATALYSNSPEDKEKADRLIEKILKTRIEPDWDMNQANFHTKKTEEGLVVTIPSVTWFIWTQTQDDNQKLNAALKILQQIMADKE